MINAREEVDALYSPCPILTIQAIAVQYCGFFNGGIDRLPTAWSSNIGILVVGYK